MSPPANLRAHHVPPRCGAFCNVFSATFEGREVAVKMLKPEQRGNDTARRDLEIETALLRGLSHRHLPKIFAMGSLESSLFMVSQLSSVVL